MSSLTNWISPGTMHSLGWTLLHFLWQGTALAGFAAVVMTLCRRASTRYALAVLTLVLMLAAPAATFFFLVPSDTAFTQSSASFAAPTRTRASAVTRTSVSRFSPSIDAIPWLVEAWLLGVAFFSLRSAGGFLLLERERRRQSIPIGGRLLATCEALQRRLRLSRAVRYCECAWLQAPAVIGWFRPVLLLPVTALTGLSEEQLQSVIVHELAHIQRMDSFVNVFQICVETLLFYHPAVWWLNKRIRAEREHCCDDVAVSLCGNPVEYARALTLMEEWRSAPALAMAANRGPFTDRIFRVLGVKLSGAGARIGLTGGLLCLAGALAAGDALLSIAYPKPVVHASARFARVTAALQQSTPRSTSAPSPAAIPAAKPSAAHSQATELEPSNSGSYIADMKAAGLGDLTIDQLIALKIQNVTPEYVRGLHEQGLHPNADNILSMRIQGVTPEYIHDLRGLGLNPDEDQIVSMKIQGVDGAYIRGLKESGIQADVDQLVSMKIQGVTPDYVHGLHEQGLQTLNAGNLVSMRIQGVTPEYIRDIQALGYKPTIHQFISLRIQGVTADYIKGLQSAGFKLDVDEIIQAKIQQISKEFIERAVKHGFQNLSLDKLIQLKNMGLLESPADI